MSDDKVIKFTNGMLEVALSDTALSELLNTQLKPILRLEVFKFSIKIFKSIEMESYQKVRKGIIDDYNKTWQGKIDKKRKELEGEGLSEEAVTARLPKIPELRSDHPDLKELIDTQSGFTLDKLEIKNADLPESILPALMVRLAWLIDFV